MGWPRAFVISLYIAVATASAAFAQPAANWKTPRTAFGQPDFQGSWTNASLTTLERGPQFKDLIVPDAEAEMVARERYVFNQSDQKPTDPSSGAPAAGTMVGYNRFWLDYGSELGRVKGTYRSSWVIDPPDGRMPLNAKGWERAAAAAKRLGYDGPEARTLGDRCLASTARNNPPMMNSAYNNNYQIAQSPTHVMIYAEIMPNARIIPLAGKRRPSAMHPLFGDAVGKWEGETLVIETTNFHPYSSWEPRPAFLSANAKTIERFTRVSQDELLYEFTIDDPVYYTQPWKGEATWRRFPDRIHEYACHEGNYSMTGILQGARVLEAQGRPLEQAGEE